MNDNIPRAAPAGTPLQRQPTPQPTPQPMPQPTPQPMPMPEPTPQPAPALAVQRLEPHPPPGAHRLRIYSHSSLFYWWPVWVVGYVMAFITYAEGQGYQLGGRQSWVHPSSHL